MPHGLPATLIVCSLYYPYVDASVCRDLNPQARGQGVYVLVRVDRITAGRCRVDGVLVQHVLTSKCWQAPLRHLADDRYIAEHGPDWREGSEVRVWLRVHVSGGLNEKGEKQAPGDLTWFIHEGQVQGIGKKRDGE